MTDFKRGVYIPMGFLGFCIAWYGRAFALVYGVFHFLFFFGFSVRSLSFVGCIRYDSRLSRHQFSFFFSCITGWVGKGVGNWSLDRIPRTEFGNCYLLGS